MSTQEIIINRLKVDGSFDQRHDTVAYDVPLCIFVNGEPFRTLIATPTLQKELAYGHLFTEGVIKSKNEVKNIKLKTSRVDVELNKDVNLVNLLAGKTQILTTACGSATKIQPKELHSIMIKKEKKPDPKKIHEIIRTLNQKSKIFKETGGIHSSILYQEEEVAFAEDVGRHNALDKVIGFGLLNDINFSECILASSGRLAGEMVLKAARVGIPVLCSVSAPLHSGIMIAKAAGILLIGFVRGQRMNQYTNL